MFCKDIVYTLPVDVLDDLTAPFLLPPSLPRPPTPRNMPLQAFTEESAEDARKEQAELESRCRSEANDRVEAEKARTISALESLYAHFKEAVEAKEKLKDEVGVFVKKSAVLTCELVACCLPDLCLGARSSVVVARWNSPMFAILVLVLVRGARTGRRLAH